MRTGEVCALTWNDIDLVNGIIEVKHNVYDKKKDDKGRWYLGTTKTETGNRKVYIAQTSCFQIQPETLFSAGPAKAFLHEWLLKENSRL